LVFPQLSHRRSYLQFAAEVSQCARALLALGVQRGDHVGIWATNWPEWVVLQFATATVGAVLVNVNPAYRSHEAAYVLEQADIQALFLTDRFKTSDYLELLAEVCPELGSCEPGKLHAAACPKLRWVISIKDTKAPGVLGWHVFLARAIDVTEGQLEAR